MGLMDECAGKLARWGEVRIREGLPWWDLRSLGNQKLGAWSLLLESLFVSQRCSVITSGLFD